MRPVKYFDSRTLKNTYFNNFYMINDILCLKEEKMSTVQPKILVYYRFERFEMINMYRTDQMASRLLKQITLTCRLKKNAHVQLCWIFFLKNA